MGLTIAERVPLQMTNRGRRFANLENAIASEYKEGAMKESVKDFIELAQIELMFAQSEMRLFGSKNDDLRRAQTHMRAVEKFLDAALKKSGEGDFVSMPDSDEVAA